LLPEREIQLPFSRCTVEKEVGSMRRSLSRFVPVLAAAGLALSAVPAAASTATAATRTRAATPAAGVVETPVSFQVRNVNRSKVPCHADGKTYTVSGHLVAPAGSVGGGSSPKAVTLYLHGLGFGQFFWNFKPVPGYDYAAAQARAGLVSVVVDRLGYDLSGKPYGKDICIGSRADIAHQMVLALRSGHYQLDSAPKAPRFATVALAGHSVGGLIAQVESYSFGDIDGLIVVAYSDVVASPLAKRLLAQQAKKCAAGGERVDGYGPGGYAPFAPKPVAPRALFADVDPTVLKAALPRLNIDPCGDNASFLPAVKADLANLRRVHVPVLIVTGGADALFPPPAARRQAALFTGSPTVTKRTIAGAGHAITLQRSHGVFERIVANWLDKHIGSAS